MTFGQMTKNACLEGSVVSTDDRTCKRSSSNPAGGDTLKNNMLTWIIDTNFALGTDKKWSSWDKKFITLSKRGSLTQRMRLNKGRFFQPPDKDLVRKLHSKPSPSKVIKSSTLQ